MGTTKEVMLTHLIVSFIYHGTAEEGLIGSKASPYCIRMFNDDVIELFKLVNKGTKVNIVL